MAEKVIIEYRYPAVIIGASTLEDLEKDGIYGCGTARKGRKGFPASLKNPFLKDR